MNISTFLILFGFGVSVCSDETRHEFAAGERIVVENSVVTYKGSACALELPELLCLLRDGVVAEAA